MILLYPCILIASFTTYHYTFNRSLFQECLIEVILSFHVFFTTNDLKDYKSLSHYKSYSFVRQIANFSVHYYWYPLILGTVCIPYLEFQIATKFQFCDKNHVSICLCYQLVTHSYDFNVVFQKFRTYVQ